MAWMQSPSLFLDFGTDQGWTSSEYKRVIQDIDKNTPNATADYIGFGYDHVTIAWGGTVAGPLSSKGPGFLSDSKGSMSIQDFGVAQGYDNTYLRGVDFVNGAANNFQSTVWSSGDKGFYFYKPVTETVHTDAAGKAYYVADYQGPFFINNFGHDQGWDTSHGINVVTAKAGDASASILGFGDYGLVVARDVFGATSNAAVYSVNVGVGNLAGGYNNEKDIRTFQDSQHKTIDLNGDGYADFVGLGPRGLEFAYGGTNGAGQFVIGNPQLAAIGTGGKGDLGSGQGWTNENTVRLLQDINHDGRLDVVAFGYDGVYVALGQNNSAQPFGALYKASSDFGIMQGWNTTDHLRLVGDVNGDGVDDIVAFGADTTFTVFGAKNAAGVVTWDASQVLDKSHQINNLTTAQGWSNSEHVRVLADVDGNGHMDLVTSGAAGTTVWSFA